MQRIGPVPDGNREPVVQWCTVGVNCAIRFDNQIHGLDRCITGSSDLYLMEVDFLELTRIFGTNETG